MTQQTWTPGSRRQAVVLVGGSQYVQDQVARACAAAGVTPVFVTELSHVPALEPEVLLVSSGGAVGSMTGQRDVVVVGVGEDEALAWATAANLASSRVVILPQGARWLAEHLGRRLHPAATGMVAGILGAAGGCGVSTFAFWCARHAASGGTPTLLVDGNAQHGGLDLALGIEDHPGVRWNDLREIRGTLNAEQLASALPVMGSLAVLSHAARSPGDGNGMEAADTVLEAARAAFGLTVVDLGGSDPSRTLASTCDHLVLLVPSRPRSVAALARIIEAHSSLPVTLVLRGPVRDGLDAWLVAELAGRPGPLPYLPSVRGTVAAETDGRMADFVLPRKVRKLVGSVVAGMERTR